LISCGCAAKEQTSKLKRLPGQLAAQRRLIGIYRSGAKLRGVAFELTFEQFVQLIKQCCSYCGSEPKTVLRRGPWTFVYNGIDRVVNGGGYTVNNTVSCCEVCNSMKADMPLAEWISHMRKVLEFVSKSPL
jgi:hypothetical protein